MIQAWDLWNKLGLTFMKISKKERKAGNGSGRWDDLISWSAVCHPLLEGPTQVDRMTHFCMWKPFQQTKVNTFLQLFEKFNMGSAYWVRDGFVTNVMMLVVYDDHDHGSRLTQEKEIQTTKWIFVYVTGKKLWNKEGTARN